MSEELLDEIEVINSIYGASTLQPCEPSDPNSRTYVLTLPPRDPSQQDSSSHSCPQHGDKSALRIFFPEGYPQERPVVLGAQHSAGGRRGAGARDAEMFGAAVDAAWVPGGVCVFDALEEYARGVESTAEEEEEEGDGEDVEGEGEGGGGRKLEDVSVGRAVEVDVSPEWVLSDVVVENKSTFVARVARITTAEQPGAYLAHLLQNDRRVRAATHNMLAWRVRLGPTSTSSSNVSGSGGGGGNGGGNGNGGEIRTAQDFDDDGETAAGSRLLKLMQAMGVWDAMVVVTRWYGGVKLGPRRFAVINGVARDGFVRAGMVVEGKKKKR